MNKNIKQQLALVGSLKKIILKRSSLNKCSNLSQPLDKLNLVGRLIATLHWFLTACWWKFWKRIERWKTWHLSNILHPDHVPTNAQSIFFFTLSWTTSSQPLGAGQWIVRSRQFASWATRSTRSDLTKSFYLKQTKLTANLSFWRIICTDKRNMFLLVFFTTVIDLTFFSQMNEKYKSKESAIIGGSTWIGSPAPNTCTCASPLFWDYVIFCFS